MKRILIIILSSLLFVMALPSQALTYPPVFVTSQFFDRGQMIWRSDIGTIFVLTNHAEVFRFPVNEYGVLPPNPWRIAPYGKVAPAMGFGKVWANYDDVRAKLGWATVQELGYNSLMVQHSNGSFYMQDRFAKIIQVKSNNTWEYVDRLPDDAPTPPAQPYIRTFEMSSSTVKPGETISITWNIENVNSVILEIYDAYPRNDILYRIQDEQPQAGSTHFTVPEGVLHGITVTIYGTNFETLSNGQLRNVRVIADTKVLNLSDEPSEPAPIETWAVFQQYEHGMMIWRRDIGDILVLFEDGSLAHYPLTYYAYLSDAPNDLDVPEGMVLPKNGFGRVWAYLDDVRDRLGWATALETGYNLTITTIDHHLIEYNIPESGKVYISPESWRY